MAGSADFKSELMSSDLFDPRLLKAVVKTVDVSYGGESGFNQAIELSAEALSSVKLVQEKKLLQKYFDEISQVFIIRILQQQQQQLFSSLCINSHLISQFCDRHIIMRFVWFVCSVVIFADPHHFHLGHWKVLLHGAGHSKRPRSWGCGNPDCKSRQHYLHRYLYGIRTFVHLTLYFTPTLISKVWENLDIDRITVRNTTSS